MITILIADDHALFRAALRKLLDKEPGFEVVAEAANGREALALVEKHRPDVLLLDLNMPQLPGLDVLQRMAEARTSTRVILLAAEIEKEEMLEALRFGASGLVMKSMASRLLYKCIRGVMAGEYWVNRETVGELVNIYRGAGESENGAAKPADYGLTHREYEILSTVVDGCTNKEIAQKFSISEQTVKHHLTSIFEKVGVSNRVELALFAMNQRMVADA
jgi:DNA-binding NarL/FixJ family response regulator